MNSSLSHLVALCQAGEEWNGSACVKCVAETYKLSEGNNIGCTPCPANETAPEIGYAACG